MINKRTTDTNVLLNELVKNQRKKITMSKKLGFADMKRICKYINTSIFDKTNCSLWQGYITNNDHPEKGIYINFYFKGKKVALHRILYINYVDNLNNDEYLKYECDGLGKCCNVNHLKKFKYKRSDGDIHEALIEKPDNKEIMDNNLDIIFD